MLDDHGCYFRCTSSVTGAANHLDVAMQRLVSQRGGFRQAPTPSAPCKWCCTLADLVAHMVRTAGGGVAPGLTCST